MSDEELLELNQKGMIPGFEESEEQFLARIGRLKEDFYGYERIPYAHWEWVRIHLKELFRFEPAFVPAFYSNRGLAPWQGAASWFEGKRLVAIQLREGLKKGSYLRMYRREEILAHEAVHAARAALGSTKWEEFFAYMTSEKKWRRVLGPIVQSPWEVWPFVLFAALGMFWEVGFFLAGVWLFLGFGRLIFRHRTLGKASEQLLRVVKEKGKTRAILMRLTDEEIEKLARGKTLEECDKKDLRWRVIRLAYF